MIKMATVNKLDEYSHECKGRTYKEKEVFDIPTKMFILVASIKGTVRVCVNRCPYITGRYMEECKAAHPHIDKVETGSISCPYVFELPIGKKFLAENKRKRRLANKDLAEIARDLDSSLHPWIHLFE